jgi:diaminopimelate epimerase
MSIPFYKYQGTGNDFIMIDQRKDHYIDKSDVELIEKMCDRRFGIGADGLILLENHENLDFEMVYFNADGKQSSMCGNGGRCIIAFAKFLNHIENECQFMAIDGPHEGKINENGEVELKMNDVKDIQSIGKDYVLDTGSPHYICFNDDVMGLNIIKEGQKIRYNETYTSEGINVNFVEVKEDGILVATYERGVEGETLSCGTGVTAAALAFAESNPNISKAVAIQAKGGKLKIKFEKTDRGYSDIWLCGPAEQVFRGKFDQSN